MKVLVVGSKRFITSTTTDQGAGDRLKAAMDQAGLDIGKQLAERGHTILVGTDDHDDVDPKIVEGALSASNHKADIEIHIPQGAPAPYPNHGAQSDAKLNVRWHQFPDWDVTNMEVICGVDGVLAIGGRAAVIQAGISAWMMGIPIIPVGSFAGGAKVLWDYGSSRRAEFYHQGLDDADIDRLASPWAESSAEFVVNALEKVSKAKNLAGTSPRLLLLQLGLMVSSLIAWICSLTFGAGNGGANTFDLARIFLTVSAAGLLGATMQTLRSIRAGALITGRRILIDTVLGITAGVVSAMLYLLAQVGMTGEIKTAMEQPHYIRVALITSMVALFAALYLDSAFDRFDKVKELVIKGKFKDSES